MPPMDTFKQSVQKMCVTVIYSLEWCKNFMMKGLFHKNVIHPQPTQPQNNNDRVNVVGDKRFLPLVIPITNELCYFDRHFNNNELHTMEHDSVKSFLIRRYYRNSDVPTQQNEPCKYQVLANAGTLMYYISEQTEFFVKNTACFFQPFCRELALTSVGNEAVMKFIVEYGRTGFCHKITAQQNKRRLGTASRKCSVLPNSYKYAIEDSHGKEIMLVKSKNCFKSNILCAVECQEFGIFFKRGKYFKGNIKKEGGDFSLSFAGEEIDSLKRFMLIAVTVLIDQQTTIRGKGLCHCDFPSCIVQCMATIFFYIGSLAVIAALLYVFVIK